MPVTNGLLALLGVMAIIPVVPFLGSYRRYKSLKDVAEALGFEPISKPFWSRNSLKTHGNVRFRTSVAGTRAAANAVEVWAAIPNWPPSW